MKMIYSSVIGICLVFMVASTSAQTKQTDLTGKWEIDISASKIGGPVPIKSSTIIITQTKDQISIKRIVKWDKSGLGDRAVMISDRGGAVRKYKLDGTDVITKMDGNGMEGTQTSSAMFGESGQLIIDSSATIKHQMGESNSTSKETWTLSDGGKILTIVSKTEAAGGMGVDSKQVFRKK